MSPSRNRTYIYVTFETEVDTLTLCAQDAYTCEYKRNFTTVELT